MASDHFYLFTALASFNRSIQERLQSVQSPEEIVAIAAEKGYQISVAQLSLFSKRLRASHWVWSNQSEQWRQNFFGGHDVDLAGHLFGQADQTLANRIQAT